MKAWLSIGIPLCMLALLTILLVMEFIEPGHWITGFVLSAGMGLAIFGFERLDRIKYQDLELQFREMQAEVKQIAEMYSEGSFLPEEPFQLTDERAAREMGLGLGGGPVAAPAVMRFVSGCITRERQRLARIFADEKKPESIASALVDTRFDKHIFQWAPPTVSMEHTPKQLSAPFTVRNVDKKDELAIFRRGNELAQSLKQLNAEIQEFDGETHTFTIRADQPLDSLDEIGRRRIERVLHRFHDKVEIVVREPTE